MEIEQLSWRAVEPEDSESVAMPTLGPKDSYTTTPWICNRSLAPARVSSCHCERTNSACRSKNAFALARAFENSVFIAAANRIGEEPSYTFFGKSMIVGPRGEMYSSMDEEIEGYALGRIDLDEVRRLREEYQLFQLRQPTTYRAIVRRY